MKATILLMSVLAGAAAATAASAQNDGRYGNGPAESTPAEMQQTDQLNQQAGAAAAAGLAKHTQDVAQYQAQQQQYQQQLQYSQEQQQRYDELRQHYNYDRARYYATLPVYVPYYGWRYYHPYGWRYSP